MYDCFTCKKEIVAPSAVASYENKYFHPHCLVCSSCKNSLSGKQFLKEKNGNLVCEECNAKIAPKCTNCKQTFGPGESYKKITDTIFYHNHCFLCCGPCHKPIGAEFYDMEDDNFLCIECYDKYGADYDKQNIEFEKYIQPLAVPSSSKQDNLVPDFINKLVINRPNVEILPAKQREPPSSKPAQQPSVSVKPAQPSPSVKPAQPSPSVKPVQPSPSVKPVTPQLDDDTCYNCREQLVGQYTVYKDRKYHTKCFTCCQCSLPFKEKTFFKLNDNPLCRDCHTKNQIEAASKCRKCFQPILDTVVTFKDGEYHDYCLTCNMCSKKLIGQSIYTDKQDKPYCVECFTKKEAKQCSKCFRTIAPSQPSLVFDSKNFHKGFYSFNYIAS